MTSHEGIAGTEIKIGLTIIAVLVVAFCWAVARRFLVAESLPPAEVSSGSIHQSASPPDRASDEPIPMILPSQDRYSGPGSYIEPDAIAIPPRKSADPYESRDQRPSLLPALPADENRSFHSAQFPNADRVDPPTPQADPRIRISESASKPPIRSVSHQEASIQAPEILPVRYSELSPGQTYRVASGDTLESIAQSELGDASYWPAIYYLNRARLGTYPVTLQAGIEIVLPADVPQ